jgi:hypothetical protein
VSLAGLILGRPPHSVTLAGLILDTLRLRDPDGPPDLTERWSRAAPGHAWAAIAALASYEQAAVWLLRRLGDRGVLAVAPAPLVSELRRLANRDAAIGMRVDAQTEVLLERLGTWGVPFVLLKGAARRGAAALYPFADARALLDTDLLMPAAEAQGVFERLRREGYEYAAPPEATPVSHYHLRPLSRGGGPTIEVHTSTSQLVPAAEAWRRANDGATDLEWRGYPVRVPSATELLWHAVTHALHHGPWAFRLRFYLDAAVIMASGREVRWPQIIERLSGTEVPDRSLAARWLYGAAELAGSPLPALGGPVPESPVRNALSWRLSVFGGPVRHQSWQAKLLDEGTRAQLGLELAPLVRTRSVAVQARRRLATIAARGAYYAWRVAVSSR